MKQKLPLGIVDFRKMRTPDAEGNTYVYVDKTEAIARMVKGGVYNFLSRPRRYGKSLLHSILYHLFSGHRELFEGLWIGEEGRWDWSVTYPVIRIDFNVVGKQDDYPAHSLEEALNRYLDDQAEKYGLTLTAPTPGEKFHELLHTLKAQTGKDVVVLIDEYDKPIVNYLEESKRPIAEANRDALRGFFSVLKGNEAAIHFLLITGVSKFGRLSIFSDLNNLEDLTLDESLAGMLGYTQEEIERDFAPFLEAWTRERQMEMPALLGYLKDWYNGYSWNGRDFVYTPWSVLNALKKQVISSYWSLSGTPKMLVDLLREQQILLPQLEGQWVGPELQDRTSLEAINPTALFWQTGYLTIKEAEYEQGMIEYKLGLPNREVRESFLFYFLFQEAKIGEGDTYHIAKDIFKSLSQGSMARFVEQINLLLAKVPYQLYPNAPQESYFHTIVFLAATLSGHRVASEVSMAGGRIDTVLETADTFYVFEFKLGASAQEALQQIEERDYTSAYLNQGKRVVAVGIAFDADNRTVGEWEERRLGEE